MAVSFLCGVSIIEVRPLSALRQSRAIFGRWPAIFCTCAGRILAVGGGLPGQRWRFGKGWPIVIVALRCGQPGRVA
ncbi:hypothetical protein [Roseovarius sp.]|uniref:hypothetical protein n=1 Tax=Roseovarius sp. TaxID=1486281 RepID=UPI0032ED5F44